MNLIQIYLMNFALFFTAQRNAYYYAYDKSGVEEPDPLKMHLIVSALWFVAPIVYLKRAFFEGKK